MTGDHRSTTTFGILLSGLLAAEADATQGSDRRRQRARSGVYPYPSRPARGSEPAPGLAHQDAPLPTT